MKLYQYMFNMYARQGPYPGTV